MKPVSIILPLLELPNFMDQMLLQFFTFSGQSAGWITRPIFDAIIRQVRPALSSIFSSFALARSLCQALLRLGVKMR